MSEKLWEQYPNDDRTYAVASAMNRGYDWVEIDINQNTDEYFDESMRNVIMDTMGQEAEFAWEAKEAIKHPEATFHLAHVIHPELIEERRRLERQANTDSKTGLANGDAFEAAQATADKDPDIHYIFFDVVNFKEVNDKGGQAVGDQAIKDIASFIKDKATEYGFGERVFRAGGDEFAILAPQHNNISRTLLDEILTEYDEREYCRAKISLRGVVAETFQEASDGMVDLKMLEKEQIQQ